MSFPAKQQLFPKQSTVFLGIRATSTPPSWRPLSRFYLPLLQALRGFGERIPWGRTRAADSYLLHPQPEDYLVSSTQQSPSWGPLSLANSPLRVLEGQAGSPYLIPEGTAPASLHFEVSLI